jgi:periplasmic divalent cation tolerance protein
MAGKPIIALSTFPKMADARKVRRAPVEKGIAGCASIVKAEKSIYKWKGKACEGPEYAASIKARESDYRKIEKAIRSMHPYGLPEIVPFRASASSREYRDWIYKGVK